MPSPRPPTEVDRQPSSAYASLARGSTVAHALSAVVLACLLALTSCSDEDVAVPPFPPEQQSHDPSAAVSSALQDLLVPSAAAAPRGRPCTARFTVVPAGGSVPRRVVKPDDRRVTIDRGDAIVVRVTRPCARWVRVQSSRGRLEQRRSTEPLGEHVFVARQPGRARLDGSRAMCSGSRALRRDNECRGGIDTVFNLVVTILAHS